VRVDGSAGPPPLPPPSGTTVHIGDLDGSATSQGSTWTALVTVTVHDVTDGLVGGATVNGNFSAGATGSGSCITSAATGQCTITKTAIRKKVSKVTFTVGTVTHASLTYAEASNHDPDGDSNGTGTAITIAR
jgi:hypothetical protein